MKIQLYYFDDCPSYQKALDNLKEALRSQELPQEVEMIPVTSEADAQAKRFIGSPTVRINGGDVEGPEAEEKGYGYGCRIYAENGRSAGWPSVERIRYALTAFQSGQASRPLSTTEEVRDDETEPRCDCQHTT